MSLPFLLLLLCVYELLFSFHSKLDLHF
ncbi:hypothetical protein [Enterococcus casseliflavus]